MTESIYQLDRRDSPLLISIPHGGTIIPADVRSQLTDAAEDVRDTDWHLNTLYDFAPEIGATVLRARISRYAVDLNRPDSGESLYPGQTTTGLCPTETFRGAPLYAGAGSPSQEEIGRRTVVYWKPYHDALAVEIARLKALHGYVVLWDAHSIASVLPRLFPGKLPDLNFGTAKGTSCSDDLLSRVMAPALASEYSTVLNGRFTGGHITRRYGDPANGVHAIQLEMCQSIYMNEEPPYNYLPDVAGGIQPVLRAMLDQIILWRGAR